MFELLSNVKNKHNHFLLTGALINKRKIEFDSPCIFILHLVNLYGIKQSKHNH